MTDASKPRYPAPDTQPEWRDRMSEKIASLAEYLFKPNETAIESLEKLLQRVRDGEVVNVAWGAVERDGCGVSHFSSGPHASALACALARCLHRLNTHLDQNCEIVE